MSAVVTDADRNAADTLLFAGGPSVRQWIELGTGDFPERIAQAIADARDAENQACEALALRSCDGKGNCDAANIAEAIAARRPEVSKMEITDRKPIARPAPSSARPTCETPGCGREIPVGGEGSPEICPKCLRDMDRPPDVRPAPSSDESRAERAKASGYKHYGPVRPNAGAAPHMFLSAGGFPDGGDLCQHATCRQRRDDPSAHEQPEARPAPSSTRDVPSDQGDCPRSLWGNGTLSGVNERLDQIERDITTEIAVGNKTWAALDKRLRALEEHRGGREDQG